MIRAMWSALGVGTLGILLLTGCNNVGEKVHETGKFIGGDSDTVVDRTPQQVLEASRTAIDDLQLIYINTDYKAIESGIRTTITARNRADEKLTITILPNGSQSTVVINTGPLSNTMLRDRALQDITYRLGLSAPPMLPIPDTTQSTGGGF